MPYDLSTMKTKSQYSGQKYSEEYREWAGVYARNVYNESQAADFAKWHGIACATIADIEALPDGEHILAEFYLPAFEAGLEYSEADRSIKVRE